MHLPSFVRALGLASLGTAASLALADPGALDRFDCHDHAETDEYHCHGDEAMADLGGLAIGLGARTSTWIYDGEDTINLFTGPAIEFQAGIGAFALQGGYHYKTLANSDEDIDLVGWDFGAKLGRGVARYGTKLYATAGYFSESLRRSGEDNYSISGFYLGAGTGYNWDTLGADIQVDWHSNSRYEDYWDDWGNPADMQALSIRTYLSYRF